MLGSILNVPDRREVDGIGTWLPVAKWWYWHTAIGVIPCDEVYGQPSSLHIPYFSGDCRVAAVDRTLKAREYNMSVLKYHIHKTQQRMQAQAFKHRLDRGFTVGDLVYVTLPPYRLHSWFTG